MADRRILALLLTVVAVLFFIANRSAYQGYFHDDDLDNLSFTREIPLRDFFTPLVYPRYFHNNFRPVGHYFYRVMGGIAGLNYTPYVAIVHLIHLLNAVLLWLLLRRLGFSTLAAGAGMLFFVFEMATFDVFWRPMYIFDLFCGFLCLVSLLAYIRGRWVIGLIAMMLAYRSKEVAIMLPVVLAAYEFLLGKRQWKRLVPFFALSLVFGLQALVQNHYRPENDYKLHADPASVWKCIQFYSSRVLLIRYAGLAIPLLLALTRDRRIIFGVLAFCALLFPMLVLPGRLFSAYLYVPLIGLSIAAAAIAAYARPTVIAAFFAVWLSWNYIHLRRDRKIELFDARDRRTFVQQLTNFNRMNPAIQTYIYSSGPVNWWGSRGVIKLAHPIGSPLRFTTVDSEDLQDVLKLPTFVIVSWNPKVHQLRPVLRSPQTADASYLEMSDHTPIWQLERGWFGYEGAFRWTEPYAVARLRRPASARAFELTTNISPDYIGKVGCSRVTLELDGHVVGERAFTRSGWQTVRWELPPAPAGTVHAALHVEPPLQLDRPRGIAVVALGFVSP